MKFMKANRIAPDRMPLYAASHLRLLCLPSSHKKDARLIWVKPRRNNLSLVFPTWSDKLTFLASYANKRQVQKDHI